MSVLDRVVAGALPLLPRSAVWRVARRYIAGTRLDDAARVIQGLRDQGLHATLDFLGESVNRKEEADQAREAYLAALERIHADSLPSGISVKLSQLGLHFSASLARSNLETLVKRAREIDRFVRIDMEDSTTTDDTLGIYRELRPRYPNVGVVLQAYLRRSLADARSLLYLGADVRICKGIYVEPPELAYKDPDEIRRSYLGLLLLLLEGGPRVAIATHDPTLVGEALRLTEGPAAAGRHEFQMLLGVGGALRERIRSSGRRLRVYVPYGQMWYAYSLRRLRENPRIAGYVFRDLVLRR